MDRTPRKNKKIAKYIKEILSLSSNNLLYFDTGDLNDLIQKYPLLLHKYRFFKKREKGIIHAANMYQNFMIVYQSNNDAVIFILKQPFSEGLFSECEILDLTD